MAISTETWRMELPDDWIRKPDPAPGQIYLEAPDGVAGIYISTHVHNRSNGESAEVVARDFNSVNSRMLNAMRNMDWQVLEVELGPTEFGASAILDFLDRTKEYRIACLVLVSLPWVVRASFHDYACSDLAESQKLYDQTVRTLKFHA